MPPLPRLLFPRFWFDPHAFTRLQLGFAEVIHVGGRALGGALRRGFALKSIVIKNFDETLGKRQQTALWRYRALAGEFYVFKHEYIFVLRKR